MARGVPRFPRPHRLAREGAAFRLGEHGPELIEIRAGLAGEGRALCRCGAISEILPSGRERKAWFGEHAAASVSALALMSPRAPRFQQP